MDSDKTLKIFKRRNSNTTIIAIGRTTIYCIILCPALDTYSGKYQQVANFVWYLVAISNMKINGLSIASPENITIGNNFSSTGSLYLYSNKGEIEILDNVSVNTNVQINASCGKIKIENNVIIAPNVVLRASNHSIDKSNPIKEQSHLPGEIIVEDDVWIGSNAVITSNVILKRGTVVGAGAVVTKSTEPYSIVAGVPAKIIGYRE